MSALSRSLVTPNKVASVIDWSRKAVMALDITENQVGICIGGRPSSHEDNEVHRLDPIRLHTSRSSHDQVAAQIDNLAREHDVCAIVVGWPLQPEGNPGKPCGKVLHTLENLVAHDSSIVSRRRPFTLWDDRRAAIDKESPSSSSQSTSSTSRSEDNDRTTTSTTIENDQPPDQWGRCVAFARAPTSKDGDTYCSQNAYDRPTGDKASGILRHFLGSFYSQELSSTGVSRSSSDIDYEKVTRDSWEEEALM